MGGGVIGVIFRTGRVGGCDFRCGVRVFIVMKVVVKILLRFWF